MIHPDELAIIRAARTHSDEDTPRLMYADWLEEHNRPEHAAFIRKSRVGEGRQHLRNLAVHGSEHVAEQFGEVGEPEDESTIPSAVARVGDHQRARYLHDMHGEHFIEQEHIEQDHTARGQRDDRLDARLGAAAHYYAAHLHEAVHQDIGSPADHQSHRAYKATNKAFDGTDRNSPRRNHYHRQAAEAHRLASVLHEQEGNETTANRHKEMADLHHREVDDR